MVMDSLTRRIRRSGPNPVTRQDGWQGWPFWDTRAVSGATVTDETALGLTAFYRGVTLIASSIAGLPLHVYEESSDGRRQLVQTPDTAYLWRRPNDEMTRQTLFEHLLADEIRGNAFIWVDKDRLGNPVELWHIPRQRVRVGRNSNGRKVYLLDNQVAMIDFKDGGEIVHIPNWGNGLMGYDPVKLAREALALGLSAEQYAASFFSEDAVPPGYLSTDQPLTSAESDRISESWSKYARERKWRRIRVLSNGAKFQQLNLEPEKSQMQMVRQFQGEEIARLLGIPPHMLGFTEKVTSWGAGLAEQSRGFVTFTLLPHIIRVEQAIDGALLVRELTNRFCKLDPDGLMRGTLLQRYQGYGIGYGRWLTPNDIRRMEDMEPVEGGDVLPAASNLIPIEQLGTNMAPAALEEGMSRAALPEAIPAQAVTIP